MNLPRYLEVMSQVIEEPPEEAKERKRKIAALNAKLNKRQAQLAELGSPLFAGMTGDEEAVIRHSNLMAEIAGIQNEVFYLSHILPAHTAGFRQGRVFERYWAARSNAYKANSPWSESRAYCVRRAAEIWSKPPIKRIGEVAETLLQELALNGLKCPISAEKVRDWLKNAAKEEIPEEYRLIIPTEAQKGGRPREA